MKKIVIFTEGQSEQIFVRHFLALVLGWENISFECFKLYGDSTDLVPFKYPNNKAKIFFMILNVGNDEKVLTAVKEREKGLIQKGYEKIIALRDMYSQEYSNRSDGVIDEDVTKRFIDGAKITIRNMSEPSKIKMHFAIMELEAWFLGMYNIFERINPTMNIGYIEKQLGFNLSSIDPQTYFFKPAHIINNIFQLIGLQYKKSEHDAESICSKMNINDFNNVFNNGKCISLKYFYDEILNWNGV
jgi:hypothetical protein